MAVLPNRLRGPFLNDSHKANRPRSIEPRGIGSRDYLAPAVKGIGNQRQEISWTLPHLPFGDRRAGVLPLHLQETAAVYAQLDAAEEGVRRTTTGPVLQSSHCDRR